VLLSQFIVGGNNAERHLTINMFYTATAPSHALYLLTLTYDMNDDNTDVDNVLGRRQTLLSGLVHVSVKFIYNTRAATFSTRLPPIKHQKNCNSRSSVSGFMQTKTKMQQIGGKELLDVHEMHAVLHSLAAPCGTVM